jgi:hypothetical protein
MDQYNQDSSSKVEIIESGENSWGAIKYYRQDTPPKLVQFVMKLSRGTVKDETQASKVLIVIASIFFVLMVGTIAYSYFGIGEKSQPLPVMYFEDLSPELRNSLPLEELKKIPSRGGSTI